MDLKTNGSAFLLIRDLFDNSTSTKPRISTPPQKPRFVPEPLLQPFPRLTPEETGVPSGHIADFISALKQDDSLDMHRVMVLRNGAVIAEADFGAYDRNVWHITHSECKSITGLAIGMLVDEGRLSVQDKLIDIFASKVNKLQRLTHKNVTVRHLLTMTSGIILNEAGSVTETNWIKCFFESGFLFDPGSKFAYNSMNTYMLSAIVKELTGEGLVEYLKPRLFEPLGITNIFWEKCPMGLEKGGWGLYILPEDIAKIGQLVLQNGIWGDTRLISRAWLEASTTAQAQTPGELGAYDYGYQMWVGRSEHTFLFNGMFGQNVLGYLDSSILLVSNAGNNELFQQSSYYTIASRYFHGQAFSSTPLPRDRNGSNMLVSANAEIKSGLPAVRQGLFKELFEKKRLDADKGLSALINGRFYFVNEQKASSVSLYPLFAQALQNNYSKGLMCMSFAYTDQVLYITIVEKDQSHRLPVGFDEPLYTEISTHGEYHRVAVQGRYTTDEDDTLVLKLRISFLECASSRLLKLFFYDGRLVAKWNESPGSECLFFALDSFREKSNVIDKLVNTYDEELLRFRISRILEPEITLYER